MTRLPPLPDEDWDDQTRAALKRILPPDRRNVRGAGNALATMVRHPELTQAFVSFNVHMLFRSTLPARLRELAILRIAHLRDCEYEWLQHEKLAVQVGLSEAEIAAAGGDGKTTDELDNAVIVAVDELDDDTCLSDQTWATLRDHLDERQVMDLVFTIGGYALLAMAFKTFGVAPEDIPPEDHMGLGNDSPAYKALANKAPANDATPNDSSGNER